MIFVEGSILCKIIKNLSKYGQYSHINIWCQRRAYLSPRHIRHVISSCKTKNFKIDINGNVNINNTSGSSVTLKLPPGLTCNHCVLQVTKRIHLQV